MNSTGHPSVLAPALRSSIRTMQAAVMVAATQSLMRFDQSRNRIQTITETLLFQGRVIRSWFKRQ